MACGSCGQNYQPPTYPSEPLTVDSYSKGSSKGVIKASGKKISHEDIMAHREGGVSSVTPPSPSTTPVAGEAGPANNQLETTNEK